MFEKSRDQAMMQAQLMAQGRDIRIRLVPVPGAGHCLYSSLQASLHGRWHAQGDIELRRAINEHGRGMDSSAWSDEVGGKRWPSNCDAFGPFSLLPYYVHVIHSLIGGCDDVLCR
jgi:hypothetical protein